MAAYAASVTSKLDRARKIDMVVGVYVYYGQCNLSNYNQAVAEIAAITGKFATLDVVIPAGFSSNGYGVSWDDTDLGFKAWTFDYDAVADGAAVEAATDTDIGTFDFVAIGRN